MERKYYKREEKIKWLKNYKEKNENTDMSKMKKHFPNNLWVKVEITMEIQNI